MVETCILGFVTFSWLPNATESRSFDFDLTKMLNCRHKKVNNWVLLKQCLVVVCVVICRGYKMIALYIANYKEPVSLITETILWPEFLLRFLSKFQCGTNVSLLSRSVIIQFLSLLSGWLSSHSVLLISKIFLWPESCLVSLRIFVWVVWVQAC